MKEVLTSFASLLGALAFLQSIFDSVFPSEFQDSVYDLFGKIFDWLSSYCYFEIKEFDGFSTNELYSAVQLYLSTSKTVTGGRRRIGLTRLRNSSSITSRLSGNVCLVDTFKTFSIQWEHTTTSREQQTFSWDPVPEDKKSFVLRVKKKEKDQFLDLYLDSIMKKANEISRKTQDRQLYTNSKSSWKSVPLKHPSTFETLAMDPKEKSEIIEDLKDFVNGEMFYQKTGRAWKRGYLLYGPPGTGKSSMIAAIANFLEYDIYDLELTAVSSNSLLRNLLMKINSKSIIVIEDIDCTIDLKNRNDKKKIKKSKDDDPSEILPDSKDDSSQDTITLSGLLNFIDGLWSCCGRETIFVFTTNHIDKLDPALLRSGRMDRHVHMGFCSFPALKVLMKNYMDLNEENFSDNHLLKEIEEQIHEAEITPADVSEIFIKNKRDKDKALKELLQDLKNRREKKKTKDTEKSREEERQEDKTSLESLQSSGGIDGETVTTDEDLPTESIGLS